MLGLTSALSSSSEKEQHYALSFDGVNDYVKLGPSNGIITASQDPVSFSCWVKTTLTSQGYIFSCQRSAGGSAFSVKIADNGIASGVIWNGVSAHTFPESTTVVNDGNWHHLAIVAKNGNQKIYVDGALEDTHTSTMDLNTSTDDCTIGAHSSGTNYRYNGSLAGFAVYTVELDADAIASIYNAGRHHNLNTPIGNYSSTPSHYYVLGHGLFDDRINGVIHDQSNPGFGSELLLNADFSAYEAETQANLIGGVQFDNWLENTQSGQATFTSIDSGFRRTVVSPTTSSWHQRVNQNLHETIELNKMYRFMVSYLTSNGHTMRIAIQNPGSTDLQSGGSFSSTAGIRHSYENIFKCDVVSDIDMDIFSSANQDRDVYYEISNISLVKLNGAPGEVEGATFVTDN